MKLARGKKSFSQPDPALRSPGKSFRSPTLPQAPRGKLVPVPASLSHPQGIFFSPSLNRNRRRKSFRDSAEPQTARRNLFPSLSAPTSGGSAAARRRRDAALEPAVLRAELQHADARIHGEQDYRAPNGNGLELYGALQAQGVPSPLVIFPDGNHWGLKPENAIYWQSEMQSWLARTSAASRGWTNRSSRNCVFHARRDSICRDDETDPFGLSP